MIDGKRHLIDIVKYRMFWLLLTILMILPGLVAMVYSTVKDPSHLPLKVGIDYVGGTVFQFTTDKKIDNNYLETLRGNLENAGVESPSLQIINANSGEKGSSKDIISIRTKFIDENSSKTEVEKITSIIKQEDANTELASVNSIGPTLGKELFKNSLFALCLACLGIVMYLTLRFQLDFALTAIIAVFNNVLFVLGAFSILGLFANIQIDGLFITAILTVIGFSVHDTIVVFDRIRENLKYYSKKFNFGEIVNISVNQTFARSINTSLTTLITLFALYFFGGVTTKDFVLAMILGIAFGTYSSIFFASMLIDVWRERKQKVA